MTIINREDIKEDTYREILDVETHHDHLIQKDAAGVLRWVQNDIVRDLVDKLRLNEIWLLFSELGLTKNDEILRKMYRDMGYSLFGYWEIFYWEVNNPDAGQYLPPKK